MRFILRLVHFFNTLSGGVTAKTKHKLAHNSALHHNSIRESSDSPSVKPGRTVRWSKEFIQNHTLLDFDLSEALRLRSLGWGNRRIARQMNNVGKDTVRKRLQEYDAAEALKAKPIPAAPKPAPVAVEPRKPTPQQPQNKAATITEQIVTPPPAVTLTRPPPITNLDELAAMRKARYGDRFPADLMHVFIVRPPHVQYGLGSEQPVIGFDRWRDEYRLLGMFQPPTKFYVIVNAEDGPDVNSEWLTSIASDIWLRERCLVARIERCGVLGVFQLRYSAQRQYRAQAYGARLADDTFERQFNFEPMPLHSHHDLLAALSKDAVQTAMPSTVYESTGWTAPQPIPPQTGYLDSPRKEESAGGLVTG